MRYTFQKPAKRIHINGSSLPLPGMCATGTLDGVASGNLIPNQFKVKRISLRCDIELCKTRSGGGAVLDSLWSIL